MVAVELHVWDWKGHAYYSYLSASIGLKPAALRDGKNAKARLNATTPAKATAATPRSKTKGIPTESLIRREAGHETATPAMLPNNMRVTVSTNT